MSLRDYYNTAVNAGGISSTSTFWRGQSFTAGSSYNFASIKVQLRRFATGPGTVTLELYSDDGTGKPTGPLLASGTTNGDTLPLTVPGEWREITFGAAYPVVNGTKYVFYLKATSGSVQIRFDFQLSTYAGGDQVSSFDSGASWAVDTTSDFLFENYDDFAFTPPVDIHTVKRLIAISNEKLWYEDV